MISRDAKQLVYKYGNEKAEVVEDREGEMPVPQKDQLILRHGHLWKVVSVVTHPAAKGGVPVVNIHLIGASPSIATKPVA
ncbi:MAG TPA: hypothetical protein VKR52_05935 [Terracidiphilus sp.]|nr:hypothetical protein [Terracidiphilus sp.]